MLIGIYKITNKVNGKVYIGQSTNIGQRWTAHKSNAKNNYNNTGISNAIRKYGPTMFSFEIIEECRRDELNEREKYWIKYYEANTEKGYNQTLGGDYRIISNDMTDEILEAITRDLLDKTLTMRQIGAKYNMCEDTISNINVGRRWYRDNLEYPIRGKGARTKTVQITKSDLIKALRERERYVEVAALYNTSLNTIKRRCDDYGIPRNIKELREYLRTHNDDGELVVK